MDLKQLYFNTIKFSSPFEHNEQEVLSILRDNGFIKKVWGINLSNRGKYVEVRCNSNIDCNNLIQKGIVDTQYNTTYTVEPAYEVNRTQITAFNIPLAASGTEVKQYLEENHLKVLAFERQITQFEDQTVYTGVIKYKCLKTEEFQNLPPYKTFYNNRRIGLRHPEQYEEKNKAEAEKREQKAIEQENAARNRKEKEDRHLQEEARRMIENDMWESKQREKENVSILKQLMSPDMDSEKAKALYLKSRAINKMDEVVPSRVAGERSKEAIGAGVVTDMETNAEESIPSVTPLEVTGEDEHPTEQTSAMTEMAPQEEEPQKEVVVTQVESKLLAETILEDTPRMQEIEKEQQRIDEEIKENDVELKVQKEIIKEKTTMLDEKEEDYGNFLQERADDLRKGMEEVTHQEDANNTENIEEIPSSTSVNGGIKETRILQKPNRRQSITTEPTEFVAPQNIEGMLFEEPEEGEILTQSVCSNFFKRKVNQAGISTDEEVKADEKRKTPKPKEEKVRFRMGEFKIGINTTKLDPLQKRVENDKLTPEDLEDIMIYLLMHQGDISGMKMNNIKDEEITDFIAYTCFLAAGSLNKIRPKEKSMWNIPTQHIWQALSDTYKTKDHPNLPKRYKIILNRINKH